MGLFPPIQVNKNVIYFLTGGNLKLMPLYSPTNSFATFKIGLFTKGVAFGSFFADYYQPMTAGNDGDLLTPTIMETGDIIKTEDPTLDPFWTNPNGGVFLSTAINVKLPSPVNVEGTEHTINTGKSWRWLNEFNSKFVTLTIEKFFAVQNFDQMTVGCYYFPDQDTVFANFHDTIIINSQSGTEFAVLQTNNIGGNLTLNAHTAIGDSADIDITRGVLLWVNLLFDSPNQICEIRAYDSNTFKQIPGSPKSVALGATQKTQVISFGRTDGHTGNPSFGANNSSNVAQIMIGFNNAPIFPAENIADQLLNKILWYYELEEASGTRTDSAQLLDLTEGGTVGQGTGIIDNAALYDGDLGDKLSNTFSPSYNLVGTDFTFTGWFNISDKTANRAIQYIGNLADANGNRVVTLSYEQSTDAFHVALSDGTIASIANEQLAGTIPTGQFIFYAIRWTSITQTMEVRLDSQGFTSNSFGRDPHNPGTQSFVLGNQVLNNQPWNGLIDEVGGWNRKLTDEEVDFLYNDGAGDRPSFIFTLTDDDGANILVDDDGTNILLTKD